MQENVFTKKENETRNEYIARIYRNKNNYNLTNNECARVINNELNKNCQESYYRGIAKVFNEAMKLFNDRKANIIEENDVAIDNNTNLKEKEDLTQEIKLYKKELSDLKKEKDKYEKEIAKLDSKEEIRLKVIENQEGHYSIFSKDKELKVPKETVAKIKELYCDDNGLTVSELCRELSISRRDFMLIKYAFNIVHNDVPYLDEEIENGDLEELTNNTLEKKKNAYFLKLQEKEILTMKNELKKYRQKDYIFSKITNNLKNIKIDINKQLVSRSSNILKKRSALLDLEDMHIGIKTNNTFNNYSVDEAFARAEELSEEVIYTCAELGVTEIYVNNLGDTITGIIHDSLIFESEIPIEDQVKVAIEIILGILFDLAECGLFDKIHYSAVNGNHGRITSKEKTPNDKYNFETFVSMGIELALKNSKYKDKIIFEKNYLDEGVIETNIEGVRILSTHGHNDKFGSIVQDLILMFGNAFEIHTAHLHHNKTDEVHCREVFMGRSFAGTDTYAKDGRHTSKAGQRLYIYSEGKREFIKDIIFN